MACNRGDMLAAAVAASGAFVLVGAPITVGAQQTPAVAPSLVFDGVTVIDVEHGARLPDQRVVIVANRIQALGNRQAVRIPNAAQVVDARGKYLIPGLWDMHVHGTSDLTYWTLLANGVTGLRNAGSRMPLDSLIQWRREIVAGTRVGPPRQILSGSSITDKVPNCDRSQPSIQACVENPADARHYVDSLQAAGADMIKPRDVSEAMYFVIAAEARRIGIPFGGHGYFDSTMALSLALSDSGARIIDHIHYVSPPCWEKRNGKASLARCQPLAERFRRNGTWVVPTLVIHGYEAAGGLRKAIVARLEEVVQTFLASDSISHGNWLAGAASIRIDSLDDMDPHMGLIHRTGLPLMAGTDVAPWGFALHAEVALYVAEGLTPLEALQTATLNPARFWHATDSLGTVAPGKLADLVLLDADPLVDITNTTTIRAVVANGRYFDRAALDHLLAQVQMEAKQEQSDLTP